MNVLIIEDEKPAAEKLKQLLKKLNHNIIVCDILETVEQSINWFTHNPAPDLVFMDIQLDDGICFEIFNEITIETPVIFTTAYDEYAIQAFKVNSIDYLLKPLDTASIETAIRKFEKVFRPKEKINEKLEQLYNQLLNTYKTRFFIKIGSRYRSVQIEEIAYFYINERCTFLKTHSGKEYDIDYSLEQLEKLVDPQYFFRINRNYLINIESISEILSYSTNRLRLKLKNDPEKEDLVVSRDKIREFKKWMDK
jgi:DNA-binding LytR/AlgR family response regulator